MDLTPLVPYLSRKPSHNARFIERIMGPAMRNAKSSGDPKSITDKEAKTVASKPIQ